MHLAGRKVHHAGPFVHHAGPKEHHGGPKVHHAGPKVYYAGPKVHHQDLDATGWTRPFRPDEANEAVAGRRGRLLSARFAFSRRLSYNLRCFQHFGIPESDKDAPENVTSALVCVVSNISGSAKRCERAPGNVRSPLVTERRFESIPWILCLCLWVGETVSILGIPCLCYKAPLAIP